MAIDIFEAFGRDRVSSLKKSEIIVLHVMAGLERNGEGHIKMTHTTAMRHGIKSHITLRSALRELERQGMIRLVGTEKSKGRPFLYSIII